MKLTKNRYIDELTWLTITLQLFFSFSMKNINFLFLSIFVIFTFFGISGWVNKKIIFEKSSHFFCSLFLCLLLSDFFKFSKTPLMASILNPIDSFCATANHYIFAIGTVALVAKTCIDFLKWKRRKEGGGKG